MTDAKAKPKIIKVQIKGMEIGEGMQYATAGLHVAQEHRKLLPKKVIKDALGRERKAQGKKFEPGVVYEIPEDVADQYLGRFLEVVRG